MTETKTKDDQAGQPAKDAGDSTAKPPAQPGASDPAKPSPSGELVAPDDPRAKAEIDAMIAKAVGPEPSTQEIFAAITGAEDMPQSDAQQSQIGIVARILAAEDATGVLDMGEPIKAEEIEQVELTVYGVRWMRSTFEEGPNVYAVIDCSRGDTGEAVKVTCGSVNVMTQLLKLQTMQAFPQKVKIVKSVKPTSSGYYPYWLQPA